MQGADREGCGVTNPNKMNLMACVHKDIHGSCNHPQCEFSQETPHGYQCVDITYFQGHTFCEVGDGCIAQCPHSWQPGTDKAVVAEAWSKQISEELAEYEKEYQQSLATQ
jgi:hypothetical protein